MTAATAAAQNSQHHKKKLKNLTAKEKTTPSPHQTLPGAPTPRFYKLHYNECMPKM
jgi:hypothetical protein